MTTKTKPSPKKPDTNTPAALSPPREGSKAARLIELLGAKDGTTITLLADTLGWQAHTTRAALTGLKRRGYRVDSVVSAGTRLYRIVEPDAAA